jgi:hypothetical protein
VTEGPLGRFLLHRELLLGQLRGFQLLELHLVLLLFKSLHAHFEVYLLIVNSFEVFLLLHLGEIGFLVFSLFPVYIV